MIRTTLGIALLLAVAAATVGCDSGSAPTATDKPTPTPADKTTPAPEVPAPAPAAPKALKAPIADGVELDIPYSDVLEMSMPATGGGTQRTVKLYVTELTPTEAMEKLASSLVRAGFVESAEKTMHKHHLERAPQVINLNVIDFKPGDKNGLGLVDVTIIGP